jgi:hypothetical protein
MFLLDAAKLQLRDGDVPPPPPPAPSPSPHARCAQSLSKCPCRVLVASLPPLPHPSPLTSLPQSFTACAGVSRVSFSPGAPCTLLLPLPYCLRSCGWAVPQGE